jgi:hypothetical protein
MLSDHFAQRFAIIRDARTNSSIRPPEYILITPARNEETTIEHTIASVLVKHIGLNAE